MRDRNYASPKAARAVLALSLMVLSFAVTYSTEARFHELHVFDQYNVLFDTDPNYYLRVFSEGPIFFDYRHPVLPVFVHLPIAFFAKGLSLLGLGTPDLLRGSLALLIAPLLAAGRTLVLFALFRRVVEQLPAVALLCVIDMFAACMVTVAGIPESYALSAACCAVMFWLALDGGPRGPWARTASWLMVATVSIGVTITNVIPLVVLATSSLLGRGYRPFRGAALVGALVGIALVVDLAVAHAAAWYFNHRLVLPRKVVAEAYLHSPSLAEATALGWAISHTFLAPPPGTGEVWIAPGPKPKFDFMLSYRPPFKHGWASLWRAMATASLLAMGAMGLAKHRRSRLPLAAALVILAANVLIHSFYGRFYYLYAPHWEPALIVVMAGVPLLARRWGNVVLLAFALLTIANTVALLSNLFERLAVP